MRAGTRSRCSRRASPSAPASSGSPDARARYDGEPPTVGGARGAARRATSSAATTGLGPHLDDVAIRSGDRDLRELRLAGRAAARRARAAARRGGAARRARADAAARCCSTTCSPSSTRRRRRVLAERIGRVGQAVVTATGADALPLDPAQLLEVTPGRGRAAAADGAARRRGPPRARPLRPDAGDIGRDRRAPGRAAVGETVARNAWPARIARDGTLHVHTARRPGRSSSAASRRRSSTQLATALGEDAPRALRFAPGPLPERRAREASAERSCSRSREHCGAARRGRRARRRDRGRGAARAGRESRRGEPRTRTAARRPRFLIDCSRARKEAICRAFFMAETAYTAKDITVLEGLEPVRLRPGHVHRLDGLARAPPPRLRGGRQLGRRGARGPQRPVEVTPPSGQLGHGVATTGRASRST